MNKVVCVNAVGLTDYATMPIAGGESAVDRVKRFVASLPDVNRIVTLADAGKPTPFPYERIDLASRDSASLIEALIRAAAGAEQLLYIFGDCPFLDATVTARMLDNHVRYFAEYSFADGYPYGLTPEIVSASILPLLLRLVSGAPDGTAPIPAEPIGRESLFTIIQKDINSFDIETEIAPVDLRMLRLSLTCDNRLNYLLCRNLAAAGATGEAALLEIVQKRQELLRTVPAYFNMQIIDGCPQACGYCPFPTFGGDILSNRNEMSVESFRRIVEKIQAFSPEATISVSLWGEPALHSGIVEMVRIVEESESIRLNIETSGVGWKPHIIDELKAVGPKRTEWIVSLDALQPGLYANLRGNGLEEALRTIDLLLKHFDRSVHVQAVRMNENEEHLEEFYRGWKLKTDNVIIQKYDDFCGLLPSRKVTDLSPLARHPCWHLKRDMVVLLDGTVTMCREDISRKNVLGNVFREEIEDIWNRGEDIYLTHVRKEYSQLCRGCDEYYTFNY
ncbi:MAG TPA: spiro-SPASM protein [Spirochaetia bacterium]|nr:spiro-SPASM protein [Spirochaetia bacterium]